MNKPIDPSVPLEKYFERIKYCVQLMDNGNTPHTYEQIFQTMLLAILSMVINGEAAWLWQKKATVDQTWNNFWKLFFEDYHDINPPPPPQNLIAAQGVYHGVNAMVEKTAEIWQALDSLVMAAMADWDVVE